MRKFVSLDTKGLPAGYDAEVLGGQPIVEVKESDAAIELGYRFPGFFRADLEQDVAGKKTRFEVLDAEGFGRIMESGRPELPTFGRYVQIPPGFGWKVSVELPGEPVKLEGVVVAPAQANMTDGNQPHQFEFDAAFYDADQFSPKEPVTVSGPFEMDGYLALAVHVCPFQYNPKRKVLLAHPQLVVRIALAPSPTAPGPASDAPESLEAFGNLFLNPRRAAGPAVRIPPGAIRPFPAVGPELLVVHAPAYAAAARALADWKNRRGLITETLAYAGALASAAALKQELRRRRSLLGARLRYVLLVGDFDDIPAEKPGSNTTDYYYSTRDDHGPATPFPLPWLSIGRLPIRDAAEAMAVVGQIISYERTPPTDPAYYHRFVCAAHFETSGGQDGRDYVFTMETIRAFLTSLGYDAERVYTCDTATRPLRYRNGQQVPADVAAAIMTDAAATQRLVEATTEGHVILAHRDHGMESGWVHPPFQVGHLDQVTGTVPSIFYSVNCVTGAFQTSTTTECFAEKILRMPGTAPTLIAATENSSTVINNAMMLGLFDAAYGGLLPTFPGSTVSYPVRCNRIGDALNYARAYERLAHGTGLDVLGHHEMFHVLGDPSLEVWVNEPRPLHLAARLLGRSLEVQISPLVPGCVLTIWLGSTLVRRITPVSGRVVIPIPPLPVPLPPMQRVLTVCGWAPGHRFAETRVMVRPPIPVPIA